MQIMYECRGRQFDPIHLHTDIRNIKETYQQNGCDFWILQESEHIVGSVALRLLNSTEGIGEIKRYFVHPNFQGQGFGHKLITHAIDVAARQQLKALRLDTMKSAERALTIFKANGFYEIKKYNNNDIADLFMEKNLSI